MVESTDLAFTEIKAAMFFHGGWCVDRLFAYVFPIAWVFYYVAICFWISGCSNMLEYGIDRLVWWCKMWGTNGSFFFFLCVNDVVGMTRRSGLIIIWVVVWKGMKACWRWIILFCWFRSSCFVRVSEIYRRKEHRINGHRYFADLESYSVEFHDWKPGTGVCRQDMIRFLAALRFWNIGFHIYCYLVWLVA